ncbi:methylthioribulose 1-phosphate dehydratase [Synechococcus sp. CS-1324]|uniref:methylthioribulose 1-phosphate dehydratase n=1 Tax=unclassified Synechococcus TaxID=2626047 RepID=UPI0021A8F52D|nr:MULTISPECIES: methylthioribulose 1-phosphate dehydratase [unclassified Synechococcus]MCT0230475.1 methylthioribulose 1-phosphate dehydratase [Synechococcus sp. CS-1324]MCT0234546.1 methylthioribulose 1-phosphate dehydratase [Synechococcus sp. CS-1327]
MTLPGDRDPTIKERLGPALIAVMAGVHARGWCDGTGGNFSCVLRTDPLELLMAPSGVDKGSIQPEQLIVVDAQGAVIDGTGRASAETPLHQEIVRCCAAGAVLHTHSQAATLLSASAIRAQGDGTLTPGQVAHLEIEGLEMLKGLNHVTTHETRISIPVLANDQDLGRLSAAASSHLSEAPQGLLIAGHGLYAWGSDLFSAKRHLEVLEFLLEQRWRIRQMEMLTMLTRSAAMPSAAIQSAASQIDG